MIKMLRLRLLVWDILRVYPLFLTTFDNILRHASPCFANSKVLESSLPRRRWHNIVASTGTVRSSRLAETQTEETTQQNAVGRTLPFVIMMVLCLCFQVCDCDLFHSSGFVFFVRNCAGLRQASLMLGY